MKSMIAAAAALAAMTMAAAPALAQTTHETKVSHDSSMNDGVATEKTKVTHVSKRKTSRPKKVLGVKVGHKTVTHKTERETSVSSNGDTSTTVKTQ